MIDNADIDGNQVLDFDEFLQMMAIKVSAPSGKKMYVPLYDMNNKNACITRLQNACMGSQQSHQYALRRVRFATFSPTHT